MSVVRMHLGVPFIEVVHVNRAMLASGNYKVCLTMTETVLAHLVKFILGLHKTTGKLAQPPDLFAKEFYARTELFFTKLIMVTRLMAVRRKLSGRMSRHVEADFLCHNISVERDGLHYAFWKDLKMWD